MNIVVHVPNRCLVGAGIVKDEIRLPVPVEISLRRVWRKVSLESDSSNDSGGKGDSYPARTNLKNAASEPDKQIVRAVNSQTTSHIRDNGGSQPGRGKFIDCTGHWGVGPRIAAIRHKQIAPAVKGQSKWAR